MDRNLIEVLMMDIKDPISDVRNRVLELTDFRKISFTPQKQLFYQIMKEKHISLFKEGYRNSA